jgi:signal transduction histidine kinase/DNA-binding NarL/FixJ family response regulator
VLFGRDVERAQMGALVEAARSSRSGALILRGEAGVGKTALLEDARERARDMQVLAARGVEAESELPFAGLHQLVRPALHLLERLPEPQAAALQGAFGLRQRAGEDRFLISVACLTLLSELAETRPVLCLVDDAQWLDASSADTLAFVARRLDAEGIVMLFAARGGAGRGFEGREIPVLELSALDSDAAAALIASGAGGSVATAVRDVLVEQAGGNALALVELPKALSGTQLAGVEPLPDDLPLSRNVERVFRERVRRLPDETQQVLSLIAAEGSGRLAPVLRATESAGVSADALGFAERAGLVSVLGERVEMRHPLVRSAILQGMSAAARRSTHRALAEALDDDLRLDERAWHLAAAADGPDAHAAEELERAAVRARRRSAHASAAAALERAAALSVEVTSQARRLVAAAAAAWHAGDPDRASMLLDRADPLVADRRLRADVEHLKGEIALRCGVLLDACDILIAGAEDIAPVDTRKALEMLLQAREAAGWAGDTPRTIETGHRAAALPRSDDPAARFLADLLVGVGRLYEGETAIGLPLVRDVVARIDDYDEPGWVVWAATGAQALGEEARASELLQRAIALARASGAVDELTYVLLAYVLMGLLAGRFDVAAEAAEGLTLAREAGLPNAASTHLAMLAWFAGQRGDEGECRGSAATAIELAQPSGGAFANAIAEWGVGLLELSRRRAGEAVARLMSVGADRAGEGHPYFGLMSAPDLVEACVLAGREDDARAAAAAFDGFAQPGAPTWAMAFAARCRALLSDDGTAGFEEALRLHARGDRPFDCARTEMLFGECLGGQGRRAESREQLRTALATFEQLGAAGWADRARAALRASGEAAKRGDSSSLSRLSSQELQIARLVAQGLSNREVAARLFLSPRTIDAQLRNVFALLGIASRVELTQFELAPDISGDVLRSRLARAGLAELFRDLRTMRGGALQDALARTLGDPALVVAHRLRDEDGYVDGRGDRVILPTLGGDRAVVSVERDGHEVAALIYDAALDEDPELVEAVCAAATIVLENEHLESQTRLAELQASRQRIVAAGDAERRRLERNLHDGAQQRLVALALQLSLIQAGIRRDPSSAEALVTTASEQLAQSLEELRELARGIHPAVLEHGLDSALESLASRSTVPTAVFCDGSERLPEQLELALYFVTCEALANVAKYAKAQAASVRVSRAPSAVVIEIADDGIGGADETAGTGLRGLADRVEALGGSLLVTSPAGAGTVVTAELPFAS